MNDDEWEQAVLDAVATAEATKGTHPYQRDVVALVRQQVTTARTHVEDIIQHLSPDFLVRGGMPGSPTVSLTPSGWLRSNARPRIAALTECVLHAYRSKAAQTPGNFDQWLSGADLEAAGLAATDLGLLMACGSQLQLFVNSSGLGTSAPLANVRLGCPWDIDQLLELPDAEAFFTYRSRYDLARVNVLQSLRLTATGALRRIVNEIYRRTATEWPVYRAIEAELHRDRAALAAALDGNFAALVGENDPHRRIALTFRGLHLAALSATDTEGVITALRCAVAAYIAAPSRTSASVAVVVGGVLSPEAQRRAILLLEGALPQIVAREPSGSAEFRLGVWLLNLEGAATLEDVVVAVNPATLLPLESTVSASLPELDDEAFSSIPDEGDEEEFSVGELIGSGAHADVYKVRQHRFERDIAAKAVRSEDETAVINHARALARGRHPAIVHLYGIASITLPNGSRVRALLMEYIGGLDLAERLKEATFTRDQVERFARTLIRAIRLLHKHSGFHGDLHDENIKIVDDELRIIDLYHRPSMLYSTTKSLAAHQEHDRRECRSLIVKLLEASAFGRIDTAAYKAFQAATRSRTVTLDELETGLQAALSAA